MAPQSIARQHMFMCIYSVMYRLVGMCNNRRVVGKPTPTTASVTLRRSTIVTPSGYEDVGRCVDVG